MVSESRAYTKQQQRNEPVPVKAWDWYDFRTSPSCPPDYNIHIRGGFMWYTPGSAGSPGEGWWVDTQSVDFTDADFNVLTTFTTANYYKGAIICLEGGNKIPGGIVWFAADAEHADPTDAEDEIISFCQVDAPWTTDYPVVGLVLRNNGTIATAASILPIDAVNRNRSYLWRDLRPPGKFVG